MSELSRAYVMCTCGDVCVRSCVVCSSVTWEKGPCVKQLAKGYATQRFNATVLVSGQMALCLNENLYPCDEGCVCGVTDQAKPTREELVEQCIDWLEEAGMPLQPWQAVVLRQTLLNEHVITAGGYRVAIPTGYEYWP